MGEKCWIRGVKKCLSKTLKTVSEFSTWPFGGRMLGQGRQAEVPGMPEAIRRTELHSE